MAKVQTELVLGVKRRSKAVEDISWAARPLQFQVEDLTGQQGIGKSLELAAYLCH